jgi:hypothetical protein
VKIVQDEHSIKIETIGRVHTSPFGDFWDFGCLFASIHRVSVLDGEGRAIGCNPLASETNIHSPLERITFPAEDIVGVLAISSTAQAVTN